MPKKKKATKASAAKKTALRINVDDPSAVVIEIVNKVGQVILSSKPYKSEAYARKALPVIHDAMTCACDQCECCASEEIPTKKRSKK